MKEVDLPGLSIAVVRDGKVVKVGAYGTANLEDGAPVTVHTRFHLDSVSKLFTAIAVMQLVEQHKLGLDDPVSRWLDRVQPDWSAITIRHLLTHSSGIPDDYAEEFHGSMLVDYDAATLYEHARTRTLEFRPGEQTRYNNLGYFLLTLIVERASGESFPRYIERHIFQPLGMVESAWPSADDLVPGLAPPYRWGDGHVVRFRSYMVSNAGSSYAGVSTASDLARLAAAIDRGTLLSPASWQLMQQPFQLADGSTADFGLSWEIGLDRGQPTIGKGGRAGALLLRFPGHGLTVIALGNLATGPHVSYVRIAEGIAGLYDPALAPRSAPAHDAESSALARDMMDVLARAARHEPDARLNPRWRATVPDEALAELAGLLQHVERVDVLGCDPAAPGQTVLGMPIARDCSVRLQVGGKPLLELRVDLDPQGHFATIQPR